MLKKIALLLLISPLAFAGSPQTHHSASSENTPLTSSHYLFGGGGVGASRGTSGLVINANQFPDSSGGTGNIRNIHSLVDKAQFLSNAIIGYQALPYLGIYMDYLNWGKQELVQISDSSGTIANPIFSGHLRSTSFGPGIRLSFPLAHNRLVLFSDIGIEFVTSHYMVNDSEANVFTNPGIYHVNSSLNSALAYGAGALVKFNQYIACSMEYKLLDRFNNSGIGNLHYSAYIVNLLLLLPL